MASLSKGIQKKYAPAYLEYLEKFSTDNEYFDSKFILPKPIAHEMPAFVASLFPSGEISAAYYLSGNASKVSPARRSGPVVTRGFKAKARTKIRRAVENSSQELKCFMTLTFNPSLLHPWHFTDTPDPYFIGPVSVLVAVPVPAFIGPVSSSNSAPDPASVYALSGHYYPPAMRQTIRHDYSKWKLKTFRQALTMKVNRLLKVKETELRKSGTPEQQIYEFVQAHKYRFIWTAELHLNGNIHFHLLINKYFAAEYIRRLWGAGRINVKKITDLNHAAHYISKYVTKDNEGAIQGNRYNIAAILRQEAKPMKLYKEDTEAIAMRKLLQLMKDTAKENGCIVIDSGFGVSMPYPRRSQHYRDKKGEIKKTCAVNGKFHEAFLESCFPTPF